MADTLLFSLTALKPNGSGLSGATVRILNAADNDVTAVLFGTTPPVTDASGLVTKSFTPLTGVPLGQTYRIQVNATGYAPWETGTSTAWRGEGVYVANLTASGVTTGNYTLTPPATYYASSLYSILASVESTTNAAWELIRFHIEHLDGRSAVQEIPVDALGFAVTDIHSRARLKPVPVLVPDDQQVLIDPNFSDELSITLESLTDEASTLLTDSFSIGVANMVPDREDNDLTNYGGSAESDPIKWIVLMQKPVVFRGYYFDAMIWLYGEEETYVLHSQNYDSAGVEVDTETTLTIQGAKQVQRIRFEPSPASQVSYSEHWITRDTNLISQTLTLVYRG